MGGGGMGEEKPCCFFMVEGEGEDVDIFGFLVFGFGKGLVGK